ncbi:hypothetical protein TNCV_4675061 [Trichonephila clavipes]|nr:hypothetical protein TNCV_4675061 [Trichonephila clavipes]
MKGNKCHRENEEYNSKERKNLLSHKILQVEDAQQIMSNTRDIGDGSRNSELRSNDEDDTRVGTPNLSEFSQHAKRKDQHPNFQTYQHQFSNHLTSPAQVSLLSFEEPHQF